MSKNDKIKWLVFFNCFDSKHDPGPFKLPKVYYETVKMSLHDTESNYQGT